MPKLEPRQVQRELDAGTLWPVYWLCGGERMKSRELLKRIRRAVFGSDDASRELGQFAEERLDGSETNAGAVADAARTLSLGGGLRLVVVNDAHALANVEELEALLGPPARREDLSSVCVFLAKDLDERRKFSKKLIEKAAVVVCEEVAEEEREAWIGYLAKRKGLEVPAEALTRLRSLDPWSLDSVDQELDKFQLAGTTEVLVGSLGSGGGTEDFLDAFFLRDRSRALPLVKEFAESPEQCLPLLGLMGWNARQLATPGAKMGGFLAARFRRWTPHWPKRDVAELQAALADIDFNMKQRPLLPLGLWSSLVLKFCR